MSASDAGEHSHESDAAHPHLHNEPSFIEELNDRFTELRTLLITIGSILAMLMTAIHQTGFIDFGVDWLYDKVEDDPDINPYFCEEEWSLEVSHYVIEYDVLFNIELEDEHFCNRAHTINYNITLDGEHHIGESQPFRNQYFFADRFYNLSEGTHHAFIEVVNGTIDLFETVTLDFEYDEGEQEQAVYGCTNETALNYNETATHDDGSCEYEDEEEEVTDDCYAVFYDATPRWANNNTSLYNDFDVDFSCMANVTVTVTVTVFDNNNTTVLHNHSTTYDTYHYDWDYHYIDFNNITREDKVNVQYRVYHEGDLDDEMWYRLESE